jgi:hypothetical protein
VIDLDVVIMFYFAPLWGAIVFVSCHVSASSFYDNPEQDPIPEQGSPLDELTQKWSTDVSIPCHPDDCQKPLTHDSGDSVERRRSLTSNTSGASRLLTSLLILASSALLLILQSPTDLVCCFPTQSANLILLSIHIFLHLYPVFPNYNFRL